MSKAERYWIAKSGVVHATDTDDDPIRTRCNRWETPFDGRSLTITVAERVRPGPVPEGPICRACFCSLAADIICHEKGRYV